MSHRPGCGCREYNTLTRRDLLRAGAGAAVALGAPGWLPRVSLADTFASDRDVIVSVFLRGGADGLTMVPPYFDSDYYSLRPGLAIQPPDAAGANRALDLDGNFGLAPAMAPLLEAYAAGDLLVVHAAGLENPTRSHFEAQHNVEVGHGDPPATLFTGWLGRHLANVSPASANAVLRAIGLSYGLQTTLLGAPAALPIADPAEFGFAGAANTTQRRRDAVAGMYAAWQDPLRTAALDTLGTLDLLEQIDFAGYKPKGGAEYPDEEFGEALKAAAALIKAEIGVEAIAIDLGGWDTHDNQGPIDGWMAQLMGVFAQGLAAFYADLSSDSFTDVAVLAMSEFGRNARENGSAGADHGHAGVMLALGGNIAGGRVLTDWPGLAQDKLYDDQDLAIAIDYRDVIGEILTKRAGAQDIGKVFPDPNYTPKVYGVVG